MVAVLLACIAVFAIQHYMAKREFAKLKKQTVVYLTLVNWETSQKQEALDALDQVAYETRHVPKIAQALINKIEFSSELLAEYKKLGREPQNFHMMSVIWAGSENRVDGIRVSLNSGDHADFQFGDGDEASKRKAMLKSFTGLLHLSDISLSASGLDDGREIASVSLLYKGVIVSKPVVPHYLLRQVKE